MLFNILSLFLLFIIDHVKTKSIYLSDGCKTNEDCMGSIPHSVCLNNKCMCHRFDGMFPCRYETRYRRQIRFGSLGEPCQTNDECRRTPVDGTKVCLANQCQCSSGHVPIDAYRCIRDFDQPAPSDKPTTLSTETEEPPGYGSLCSINNDCQHSTVQLECLHGTCVCLEGYVPLGKYLCYNIGGQGAPVIERSTTRSTAIFTLPRNEMVQSLGKTCTSDYYCRQSVFHTRCFNGKCTCIDGYTSLDPNTCVENSSIVDRKEDSTTLSSHYRSLLGGQCLTNRNCQTINARCINNICTCPISSFPVDDWNCLKDLDSAQSKPTTMISLLTTTTTSFQWWPWTLSSTTSQSPIHSKKAFRFRCALDRQCISIDENSHCSSLGRCLCNNGYKFDITTEGQRCIPQIINEESCD